MTRPQLIARDIHARALLLHARSTWSALTWDDLPPEVADCFTSHARREWERAELMQFAVNV